MIDSGTYIRTTPTWPRAGIYNWKICIPNEGAFEARIARSGNQDKMMQPRQRNY